MARKHIVPFSNKVTRKKNNININVMGITF
jgi:hypothetical protein